MKRINQIVFLYSILISLVEIFSFLKVRGANSILIFTLFCYIPLIIVFVYGIRMFYLKLRKLDYQDPDQYFIYVINFLILMIFIILYYKLFVV